MHDVDLKCFGMWICRMSQLEKSLVGPLSSAMSKKFSMCFFFYFSVVLFFLFLVHPRKITMEPNNSWFVDVSPLPRGVFSGSMLVLGGGGHLLLHLELPFFT